MAGLAVFDFISQRSFSRYSTSLMIPRVLTKYVKDADSKMEFFRKLNNYL